MSQLERILQRQPRFDPAEVEDIRTRAMARLSAFSDPRAAAEAFLADGGTAVYGQPVPVAPVAPPAAQPGPNHGAVAPRSDAARSVDDVIVERGAPIRLPAPGIWSQPVAADVAAAQGGPDMAVDRAADLDDLGLQAVTMSQPPEVPTPATSSPPPAPHPFWDRSPEPVAVEADKPKASPSAGPTSAGTSSARTASRPASRQPARPRAAKPRVMSTAYCPYCALALDPPPTSDQRCTRCRQQIIVRQVDGGMVVHLTEAALKIFEAERARAANIEKWTSERGRWLELARSAGAPASRIERLERPVASMESVRSARALYAAAVDHAVDEVLRRDLWEEAARLRRDQADAIRHLVGRDLPPSDEMRDLYREAARIELRGIAAMARTAAVVASRCCEACRTDDGTVHRIAAELRASRLPHEGCANGLCRCRWDLSPQDVRMVQRYLARTGRPRADAKAPVPVMDAEPVPVSTPG